MIELADKIYETQHAQGVAAYQVAAVNAGGGGATAASLDETQPAIPYPEVAAIRGQRGNGRNRGRGGRNRGGRGRGAQNSQASGGRPGPSILTCLLETSAGVECTSNTEKMHFFVVTHPRVHGKICIPKSLQNNEKLTNSAK